MIFAADLDRTLIFSKRALEELGVPENSELVPVEEKLGEVTSYMTASSIEPLKTLCEESLFVPITTRTTEQYNRIFLFHKTVQVEYAVTFNGANILFNGEILSDWSDQVSARIKNETCSIEELFSFFHQEKMEFDGLFKSAGNFFFYYLLEKPISLFEKQKLQRIVADFGWRISQQGRKLYFMPNAVSKGAALQYICERTGKEAMAGAGDSLLDRDFLHHCRHRFVPRHGELAAHLEDYEAIITRNIGVLSGEEILNRFLDLHSIQENGVFSVL